MKSRKLYIVLISLSIVCFGFLVSFFAAKFAEDILTKQSHLEFNLETDRIVENIRLRLNRDIYMLYGYRGLFEASESVARDEFNAYSRAISLEKIYPGVNAVGYQEIVSDTDKQRFIEDIRKDTSVDPLGYPNVSVFPESVRDQYLVLKYGFPEKNVSKAYGFDIFSDKTRSETALRARDLNDAVLSSKIQVLPDNNIGFQIYLPLFKNNSEIFSQKDRENNLQGFIVASFLADQFFNDINAELSTNWSEIDLHVFDLYNAESNKLYSFEKSGHFAMSGSHIKNIVELRVANHVWLLDFTGMPDYGLSILEKNTPSIFLVAGSLLGILAALVLYGALNAKRKALLIAEEITKELKQSEEKFKSVSDAAEDAIVMMDENGNVVLWNRAAEIMTGYTAGEIMGKNLHNIIPFEVEHRTNKDRLEKFSATGESTALNKPLDLAIKNKAGQKVEVELTVARTMLRGKWHAVGIMRDITQRKIEAEKIKKANQELQRLNNLMVDRELKMMELKKKLANSK
ncbi:MAG TPA: CHASE domain-containing protein [Candidatus Magasanikbacteria bacterium]|nr:CHASE domain-containing protein [Candidatus Magasanikbacteria bacterium]